MAKKAAAPRADAPDWFAPKFRGKTFAFAGQFNPWQRERIQEDGFSGAGLAREDREAAFELEVERVDDDEVADRQQAQHGMNRPYGRTLSGVSLQCSFSRSIAK